MNTVQEWNKMYDELSQLQGGNPFQMTHWGGNLALVANFAAIIIIVTSIIVSITAVVAFAANLWGFAQHVAYMCAPTLWDDVYEAKLARSGGGTEGGDVSAGTGGIKFFIYSRILPNIKQSTQYTDKVVDVKEFIFCYIPLGIVIATASIMMWNNVPAKFFEATGSAISNTFETAIDSIDVDEFIQTLPGIIQNLDYPYEDSTDPMERLVHKLTKDSISAIATRYPDTQAGTRQELVYAYSDNIYNFVAGLSGGSYTIDDFVDSAKFGYSTSTSMVPASSTKTPGEPTDSAFTFYGYIPQTAEELGLSGLISDEEIASVQLQNMVRFTKVAENTAVDSSAATSVGAYANISVSHPSTGGSKVTVDFGPDSAGALGVTFASFTIDTGSIKETVTADNVSGTSFTFTTKNKIDGAVTSAGPGQTYQITGFTHNRTQISTITHSTSQTGVIGPDGTVYPWGSEIPKQAAVEEDSEETE